MLGSPLFQSPERARKTTVNQLGLALGKHRKNVGKPMENTHGSLGK